MADESVKILIEAEDQASQKMLDVARNSERLSGNIKSAGGAAKKSAELYKALGSSVGGLPLGSAISQFGELADKVGAFTEVTKLGAVGTVALGAGIIGAGVALVQGVLALREYIQQTEKLAQANKLLREENQKAFDEEARMMQKRLDARMREVDYAAPTERNSEALKQYSEITAEINRQKYAVEDAKKMWKEWDEIRANTPSGSLTEAYNHEAETAKQTLAQEEEKLKLLQQQKEKLEEVIDPRRRELEALQKQRQEIEAQKESGDKYVLSLAQELELLKANEEEQRKILAARNTWTAEQNERALALQKEIDGIKQKAKADEEAAAKKRKDDDMAQARRDKEKQDRDNAAKAILKQIDGYEQQVVALAHGEEAAKRFAMAQEGMEGSTASSLARVDAIMKQASKMGGGASPDAILSASGGRLSTGRAEVNQQLETAKNSLKMQEKMKSLLEEARNILQQVRDKESVKVTQAAA